MPRTYSEIFLRELAAADQNSLGIRLANACVKGRLPASYVAKYLKVSQRTIHLWFRNRVITLPYFDRIEKFIKTVEEDLARQILPAKDLKAAKRYLAEPDPSAGAQF